MTWLANNWIWALLIGGGFLYLLSRRSGHHSGSLAHPSSGTGQGDDRDSGRHHRGGS